MTPPKAHSLSRERPHIRYRHREGGTGLSSAILEGFRLARGFWFIVMDADLQHPPESLPALVREAKSRGLDGVVCGHIHHAEVKDVAGILYCNDGDWVESCTALTEDAMGRLRIVTWADPIELLGVPVSVQRPLVPKAA